SLSGTFLRRHHGRVQPGAWSELGTRRRIPAALSVGRQVVLSLIVTNADVHRARAGASRLAIARGEVDLIEAAIIRHAQIARALRANGRHARADARRVEGRVAVARAVRRLILRDAVDRDRQRVAIGVGYAEDRERDELVIRGPEQVR